MEVMIAILIITSIILSIFFVYNAVKSDDLPHETYLIIYKDKNLFGIITTTLYLIFSIPAQIIIYLFYVIMEFIDLIYRLGVKKSNE